MHVTTQIDQYKQAQNQLKSRLIELINNLLNRKLNKKLSREQKLLLSSLWFGKNFDEIAELHGRYSPDHFKQISESLWNLLSCAIASEINANNFKTALQLYFYPNLGEISITGDLTPKKESDNVVYFKTLASPEENSNLNKQKQYTTSPKKIPELTSKNNSEINRLINFTNELLKSQFNTLLKTLEVQLISGVLKDFSYEDISLNNNASIKRVKNNASNLYKKLSTIFGVKVNKKISTLL